MRCVTRLLVAAGLALLAFSATALAQGGRTIRAIVPYPPGGSADVLMRILAQQVNETAGTNIVIENRPGAGTVIATEFVSRAPADGNTVLVMSNSFVINAHMRKLAYDPLTSFSPVCDLVSSPNLIVVDAASPYRTLADLVAASRQKPGALTMASVGPATTQHIGFEQLKLVTKAAMTYVPFPGGAPAINALLGDHVTAVYGNYSEVVEQLKAGKLRALVATGAKRMALMPDLPTVAELGYPGYDVEVWLGTVVPAGTPTEAITQLQTWFTDAMKVPAVRDKLVALGLYPAGICGADFSALIRRKNDEYAKIMQEAGIKGE
ncbi:MAG TPA: tripartite tricarboxylate transporter substrate binding protein [Xanthobacteraceae bacterium]|nr:tripartite tricarboxylate transporter substrate binding protein [Xanthobacteraceae bacterium]